MTVVKLVAATLILTGCGNVNQPEVNATDRPTTVPASSCQDELARADEFFALHPAGPAGLSRPERAELGRVVAAIEAACDAPTLETFGSDQLEPWSTVTAPRSPAPESMTTVPAVAP